MSTQKDFERFDFSFDPQLDELGFEEPESMDDVAGADPGVFLPNTEGITEFLPPDPARAPEIPNALEQGTSAYAARPAEERTRELFAYMNPHRQVLLGILEAALEPRPDEQLREAADKLREHKFSVYSAANLCSMLEKAGALERATEDGTPYANYVPRPDVVVVDGEEFYQPSKPPAVWWHTSEAGRRAVEANRPLERAERQFEREPELLPLYKRVLTWTSREEGATMTQLSGAVDSDPLISEPRRFFVQHFVEALERCECIVWQKTVWKTTEVGRRALEELLADVEDALLAEGIPAIEEPEQVPTETQGVSW